MDDVYRDDDMYRHLDNLRCRAGAAAEYIPEIRAARDELYRVFNTAVALTMNQDGTVGAWWDPDSEFAFDFDFGPCSPERLVEELKKYTREDGADQGVCLIEMIAYQARTDRSGQVNQS